MTHFGISAKMEKKAKKTTFLFVFFCAQKVTMGFLLEFGHFCQKQAFSKTGFLKISFFGPRDQ